MTTTPAELVAVAHRRQLALRLEATALQAALSAGHTTTVGQYAYALSWLSEHAATRLMRKDAAPGDAASPAAPPTPQSPQGAAGPTSVPAPPSGLGVTEREVMFGKRKPRR